MNRVTLIGNLGRDPAIKHTPSGRAVAEFSVACTERFKDKDGKQQERTEWVNVVLWGDRAEKLGSQLSKGSQVFVEGKLATRSWEKDGQKHYKTEVVADLVYPIARAESAGGERQAPTASRSRSVVDEKTFSPPVDDDIPF